MLRMATTKLVLLILVSVHSSCLDAGELPLLNGGVESTPSELTSILSVVKTHIVSVVPWKKYKRWACSLSVDRVAGDESPSEYELRFISEWEKESGKRLKFKYGEDLGNDVPSLAISLHRYDEDIVVVRIEDGLPTAGTSRELVFRKIDGRWGIRREILGGQR